LSESIEHVREVEEVGVSSDKEKVWGGDETYQQWMVLSEFLVQLSEARWMASHSSKT
jgi:hypothetical protein